MREYCVCVPGFMRFRSTVVAGKKRGNAAQRPVLHVTSISRRGHRCDLHRPHPAPCGSSSRSMASWPDLPVPHATAPVPVPGPAQHPHRRRHHRSTCTTSAAPPNPHAPAPQTPHKVDPGSQPQIEHRKLPPKPPLTAVKHVKSLFSPQQPDVEWRTRVDATLLEQAGVADDTRELLSMLLKRSAADAERIEALEKIVHEQLPSQQRARSQSQPPLEPRLELEVEDPTSTIHAQHKWLAINEEISFEADAVELPAHPSKPVRVAPHSPEPTELPVIGQRTEAAERPAVAKRQERRKSIGALLAKTVSGRTLGTHHLAQFSDIQLEVDEEPPEQVPIEERYVPTSSTFSHPHTTASHNAPTRALAQSHSSCAACGAPPSSSAWKKSDRLPQSTSSSCSF